MAKETYRIGIGKQHRDCEGLKEVVAYLTKLAELPEEQQEAILDLVQEGFFTDKNKRELMDKLIKRFKQ